MWLDATRGYTRMAFATVAVRGREEAEIGHSMRHFLELFGFFGAGGSRAATIAYDGCAHVSRGSRISLRGSTRRKVPR